jgi:hypothetical protein
MSSTNDPNISKEASPSRQIRAITTETTGRNRKSVVMFMAIFIVCFCIYSFNYYIQPSDFEEFQQGSESLVIDAMNHNKGSLDESGFGLGRLDADGVYNSYESQVGLQGIVFGFLNYNLPLGDGVKALSMCCAAMMAFTVGLMSVLLVRRFSYVMGITFAIVFAFSPWVTAFARNLYWVEFTWLLPWVVGLLVSLYGESKMARRLCYAGAFLTILIKSLCGYEYLSAVTIGVVFLFNH